MRLLKWIGAGLALVLVTLSIAVFGTSQWARARTYDIEATPAPATTRTDGPRLARAFGCRDCHGDNGQGQVLLDSAMVGRLVAPSLAQASAHYSDAELARVIRRGVKKDGTGVVVMPSPTYSHMADEDLGAVIKWIRTLRPSGRDVAATTRLGPMGRFLLASGKLPMNVVYDAPPAPARRPADIGAYVYSTTCSDCHALYEPRPAPEGAGTVPALAPVAASYSREEFLHLFRTGKGTGNRELGMMSMVARKAFSAFDDQELIAAHDYLKRKAEEAPPQ